MTVEQLIGILEKLNPDAEVIISTDPEGNNFSSLDGDYSEGYYDSRSSEFFEEEDAFNFNDSDFLDDDDEDGRNRRTIGVEAVCLWPAY